MNILDYVLLGVLLAFLVVGYFKGFLAQLLHIVAIAGAFVLASRLYLDLAAIEAFGGLRAHSESAAQVTSFLVIFFVSAAVLSVLASLISRKLRNVHLKAGDRWLGALFATAQGVLLLGGVALGLQEWRFPQGVQLPAAKQEAAADLVTESYLVPRLAEACLALVSLIPEAEREKIAQMVEERRLHLDPPEGGDASAKTRAEADDPSATRQPVAEPRPREELLPFGTLRRLTLQEGSEPKPVPASGKAEEAR